MPALKPTPTTCNHNFVKIIGIRKAWSDRDRSRIVKGQCDQCRAILARTIDEFEIKSGKTEVWYRP